MDIAKAITEVGGFLKEDAPESVKTTLEGVKREFSTMQISLSSANEESKGRKEKIRTLQDELDDAQAKVAKLSDTTKVQELETEYAAKIKALETDSATKIEEFEKEKAQLLAAQNELHGIFKTEVQSDLEIIKEHPAFEKIQGNLKLPEVKEDKSFDYETYSIEDVLHTKAKLVEYKNLGLFGESLQDSNPMVPKVKKIDDDVDITALAKSDPVAARKWLDAKRHKNPLFS